MANTGKNKYIVAVFATFVILLVLFSASGIIRRHTGRIAGRFFHPYLWLCNLTDGKIADKSLLKLSHRELAEKISQLQKNNRQLVLLYSENERLLQENQRLRQLAKLPSSTNWNCIAGEVVLRDPVFWNEHFTVNRGEQDGIKKGSAVLDISPEGRPVLIGIVGDVQKNKCTVFTVFNPSFTISFRVKDKLLRGFIHAGGQRGKSNSILLDYIPANTDAASGDVIETTGFEEMIPSGVVIGNITALNRTDPRYSSELYVSGEAASPVDLDMIKFVVIAVRQL